MKTLKFMLAVAASIVASCVLADRVVDADYTLAADEDWSAAGRVLMADGVKIDLNGHSLKTSGFAEYIPVAYVETDGSQWVNTRYTPAGTDKVEMKFQMKDVTTQQFILCSRKGTKAGDGGFGLWTPGSDNLRFIRRNANGLSAYEYSITKDTDYVTVHDYNEKWVEVNGVKKDFSDSANGEQDLVTSGPFALFCAHTAGASLSDTTSVGDMAKCRFYYMKVWDKDGNLKCDIIPAIGVNENALGLYDRVRGLFLKPVANGGAATEFANKYPEVDHLDTDGTMYVDTQFTPSLTNAIEVKVQMLKDSGTQVLVCTRGSSSNVPYEIGTDDDKFTFVYSIGKFAKLPSTGIFSIETDYTLRMSPDTSSEKFNVSCSVDDDSTSFASGFGASNKPSFSFYLFARRKGSTADGNYATCRFYSFKAYDNKDDLNLVCDIVPVYGVSEKKFGLYDRSAGRFLSPTGNDFKAPLDISIVNGSETKGTLETAVEGGNATTNSVVSLGTGMDFVKSGDGEWVCAKGLGVGGSFALNGGTVGGVTMQNESVLDFSARTTPLDLDTCGLAFASGATIYVAVGNRSITASAPLASWTTAPSGVTFRRDAAAPRRFSVWTTETGLYAAYRGLIISFH